MPWSERAADAIARMAEGSAAFAPVAAFLGGALTAFNPCVLAMIPLMIGFTAGIAGKGIAIAPGYRVWPRTLAFSLVFVVGFAIELALLFTVFSSATRWLSASWWEYVLIVICTGCGLHLLGVVRIPSIPLPSSMSRAAGVAGALVLGFLFGLVSLPCTGPVLLLLIGLVPQIGPARAGGLLFLYGLGHSLVIVVVGTAVGVAASLVRSVRLQTAARRIRQAAGVLILSAAAWMLVR